MVKARKRKELDTKTKLFHIFEGETAPVCINEDLKIYIDRLEKSTNLLYSGKDISEVKRKARTLKRFISPAEAGLWFARSFGLEIKSLVESQDLM